MTTRKKLAELISGSADAERLLSIVQCPPDGRGANQALLIGATALDLIADPVIGAGPVDAEFAAAMRDTAYAMRAALYDDDALMAAVAMPASTAGRTRARGYCERYPVWAVCMHTDTPSADDRSPVIPLIALLVAASIKAADEYDEHKKFFTRVGRYLRALDDGHYDAWIVSAPAGFDDSRLWDTWLDAAGRGAIRGSTQWRVTAEWRQLVRLAFHGERRRMRNDRARKPDSAVTTPVPQYGWLHAQGDGPPRRAWTSTGGGGECGAVVRSRGEPDGASRRAGDAPGGDHPETHAVVYHARQDCVLDSPYYSAAEAAIASRHQAEAIKRHNNTATTAPVALAPIDIAQLLTYNAVHWEHAPYEDRAAMCLAELTLWTGRDLAELASLLWRSRGTGVDCRNGVLSITPPGAMAYLKTPASESVRPTASSVLRLPMPAPTRGRLIALGRFAPRRAPLWAGTPDQARTAVNRILEKVGLVDQDISIAQVSRVCGPAVARACRGDWCAAAQITGRVPSHARSQVYYTHTTYEFLLRAWQRAIDHLLDGAYRESPNLVTSDARWSKTECRLAPGLGSRVTPSDGALKTAVVRDADRRFRARHAALEKRVVCEMNTTVRRAHLALLLGVGARGVREPIAFDAQWDGRNTLLLAEKAGADWDGARIVHLPEWVVQALTALRDERGQLGLRYANILAGLTRLLDTPYVPSNRVRRSRAMQHAHRLPLFFELDPDQFAVVAPRQPLRHRARLFHVPSATRLRDELLPDGLPLNAGRHGLRSDLVAAGVGASSIDAYFGHWVLGTSALDGASTAAQFALTNKVCTAIEPAGHGSWDGCS